MTRLQIYLLGDFKVMLDDEPLEGFRSHKVRGLLAYLSVEAKLHDRQSLAALLWGEYLPKSARANLRVSLGNLRKVLTPLKEAASFLTITRQTVQFDSQAPAVWVDIIAFDSLLAACQSHQHEELASCAACRKRLRQAADLYRGHFLADLMPDSEGFNDWCLLRQEGRLRQVMEALSTLAEVALGEGQLLQAEADARRQLELIPWQENAHRQLMRALALSGQQTAALAQYQRYRDILSAELGVEPDEESQTLYRELKEGRYIDALLEQKEEQRESPTYLAAPLTPLIGRQSELKQLTSKLLGSTCRLLTVVGLGGIGKTKLTLAAARQLRETFRDGVFFVSLLGTDSGLSNSADLLIETVLSTLQQAKGFATTESLSPAAMLRDTLREKELLLLLDNFEPLLEWAPLLTEWLADAPSLRLLVTSRQRLDLHGESIIELLGLQSPSLAQGVEFPLQEALAYPAVQLFSQCAKRVNAQFKLEQQNISSVVRICDLIGGMPLAIELAAAWMHLLPAEQIAQQIEANLTLLVSKQRNIPARHRNVEAIFEHTWARLDAAEQEVLANLSVFTGSFSRRAIRQVVYQPKTPLLSTLQIERNLLDKALIQITSSKRVALHPLLRHYASQKLSQRHDAARVHEQHSAYYAAFVQAHLPKGQQQQANVQAISREIENIRTAWHWSVSQGKYAHAGQMVKGLYRFYHYKGRYEEGEATLERAVVELDNEPAHSPQQQLLIAQLRSRLGTFCGYLGKLDRGLSLLQSSLSLAVNLNARSEMAFALRQLSGLSERNIFKNDEWLKQALSLYRTLHDEEGIAATLHTLGMQEHLKGHYQQAKEQLEESLILCRQAHDQLGIANQLRSLGNVSVTLGKIKQAYDYHQESLTLARALNNDETICYALRGLVTTIGILEHYEAVQPYIEEALQREIQNRNQIGIALTYFSAGLAAFYNANHQVARQHFESTLPILRRLNEFLLMSISLSMLGSIALILDNQLKSGIYYQEALQMGIKVSAPPYILLPLLGIAVFLSTKNKSSQSVELLTLVMNHPMSSQGVKMAAQLELAKIAAQLPPDVVAAAQERGRTLKLEEVAHSLLRSDFSQNAQAQSRTN